MQYVKQYAAVSRLPENGKHFLRTLIIINCPKNTI